MMGFVRKLCVYAVVPCRLYVSGLCGSHLTLLDFFYWFIVLNNFFLLPFLAFRSIKYRQFVFFLLNCVPCALAKKVKAPAAKRSVSPAAHLSAVGRGSVASRQRRRREALRSVGFCVKVKAERRRLRAPPAGVDSKATAGERWTHSEGAERGMCFQALCVRSHISKGLCQ